MRLVTFRTPTGNGTSAGRIEGDEVIELPFADVAAAMASGNDWPERLVATDGERLALSGLDLAPLIPSPSKIFCVGLNYLLHVEEAGSFERSAYPTLFAKFPDSLTGAHDDIQLPAASDQVDWEAELVVVIGQTVRDADVATAAAAIAGFAVGNDLSMRDYQSRTPQWLQGKCWARGSPVGPALVTPDEVGGPRPDLQISCEIDGEVMQDARTSQLLFDPVDLVRYISTIIPLRPGDLIFTGTPEGVGAARTPPVFLEVGNVMTTRIEGVGELVNAMVSP